MIRARIFMASCWLALAVGLVAVFLSATPGGGRWMGAFMFDHVLVLFNLLVGSWILKRAHRSAQPFRWPGARRVLAPWLIATGCVAAVAMVALHVLAPIDVVLPSGEHLRLVANDFSTAAPRGSEHSQDASFGMFAHLWVVFAFTGLCVWHVIGLRADAARRPAPADQAPMSPRERADADDRLALWRLPLIVAIWVLGLAWSTVAMLSFVPRDLCGAPFPWPFALLPAVLFPLSGLFAKRAPYHVPWFEEIVDARFGAGACVRFLASLKPMLLLSACGLVAALTMRHACASSGFDAPFPSLFMASAAVGFLLFYGVLRVRGIEGA